MRRTLMAFAVAVLLAGCGEADRTRDLPTGPLGTGVSVRVGFPATLHHTYTIGHIDVINRTGQPAMWRGFRLLGASPGIEVVGSGALIRGLETPQGSPQASDTWPDPLVASYQHPVKGFVLPSQEGRNDGMLLLGLRVESLGRFTVRAVAIDYVIAGKQYQTAVPYAVIMCGVQNDGVAPACSDLSDGQTN